MPNAVPFYERIDRLTIPEPNSGCWLWIGRTIHGYAVIQTGKQEGRHPRGKSLHVAHVNFERFVGPLPDGMLHRHTCDVRECVNPMHVIPGSQSQNMRDMVVRGRCPKAKLTRAAAEKMRELKASGVGTKELSHRFRVCPSTVRRVTGNHSIQGGQWRF